MQMGHKKIVVSGREVLPASGNEGQLTANEASFWPILF